MATSNNSISGIDNIDYIINHSNEFKYFRKNRVLFGKFKNYSYEDIYKEKEWYCLWLKKNVENPNGELLNFINFLKKYDNDNFILPLINYDQCKILLFNEKICLNKFLDELDPIFSIFFAINFY